MSTITAVYTKWGWVSQRALYLIKRGYEDAVEKRLTSFRIGEDVMLTQFAGYLIQYLEGEGLVPEKTESLVALFEPAQGIA